MRTADLPEAGRTSAAPRSGVGAERGAPRSFSEPVRQLRQPRRLRLIAALTATYGVVVTLPALRPFEGRWARVEHLVDPLDVHVTTRVASLAIGMGLLYLAGNLARRKQTAWLVALALFAGAAAVQVAHVLMAGVRPGLVVQLAFTTAMATLLVLARRQFYALSDPPSFLQFLRFVPVYAGVVLAYGLGVLTIAARDLDPAPTLGTNLLAIGEGLVGIDVPYTFPHPIVGEAFEASLLALGVLGLAVTLVLLFRPIVAAPRSTADHARARDIVEEHGDDTLAAFALRPDKSYFFSSDGRAFVAYAFLGRCALVSGDPIGHPDSIGLVIDEFLAMCRAHGWGHTFLAVRDDDRDRYARQGLRTFYLGDEAVIDCHRFTLDGKKNKSMRQSVGRVARTHRFELVPEAEASPALAAELEALSARWRGRAPERGFTMASSRPVGVAEPAWLLAIARDEAGRPDAFLRLLPIAGEGAGYTLDLMRRDPDAPNGTTEFLVANTVFALRDAGHRRLSLNFAVMGRLFGDDLGFTRRQKLLRWFIERLNPFFQIKSLHDFNRRFRPDWVARAVVCESHRALPRVALLYGAVEGFVALPGLGRVLVPRRSGSS